MKKRQCKTFPQLNRFGDVFESFVSLSFGYSQKFRKGVGGQRGLGWGNPSYARYSGLSSVPFFVCPLREGGHISGELFGLFLEVCLSPTLGGQNLYTQNCAKRSRTNTWKALWCICLFLRFPWKQALWYTPNLFLPVEALEFSELKTPLVYTFVPPKSPPANPFSKPLIPL